MAKQAAPIRNLSKEREAVAVLLDHLKKLAVDTESEESPDSELIRDTIEGETDFFEALDKAIESVAMDQAHVAGLESMAANIKARIDRKAARIEMTQAAILNALETAGIEKHEAALATISQAKKPLKVIVTDESTIPSKWFRIPEPPPPAVDKKALLDYFKERAEKLEAIEKMAEAERPAAREALLTEFPAIPGAELSNRETRLNMRFK